MLVGVPLLMAMWKTFHTIPSGVCLRGLLWSKRNGILVLQLFEHSLLSFLQVAPCSGRSEGANYCTYTGLMVENPSRVYLYIPFTDSSPIWKKIRSANMSVFRIYEKPHMLSQRNSHVSTIILLFVVRRSYWRSGPINPMKLSPQKTL